MRERVYSRIKSRAGAVEMSYEVDNTGSYDIVAFLKPGAGVTNAKKLLPKSF